MLCGSNHDGQAQLATAPGAIRNILAIVRNPSDLDAQLVARGLFTNLARNSLLREPMEDALREMRDHLA